MQYQLQERVKVFGVSVRACIRMREVFALVCIVDRTLRKVSISITTIVDTQILGI